MVPCLPGTFSSIFSKIPFPSYNINCLWIFYVHFDVFVKGTDNALYHKYWNGSQWSKWQNLGGTFTSGPAAVSGDRIGLMYLLADKIKI